MSHAFCPLPLVPVRKEPSDRSEMTTQWLFGETATVTERQAKWSLLSFHHDGYTGWVDNKQFREVDAAPEERPVRSAEQCTTIMTGGGALSIPFGGALPSFSASHFKLGTEDLAFPSRSSAQLTGTPVQRLLAIKDQWSNAPYLWGGRSPFGVDCSGLTQQLFLVCGVSLPRDAYQQATMGRPVELIDLATTGDLAFFDNEEGRIVHVGIVLADRRILHASGHVRVDHLDQQGIFDTTTRRYTHNLRLLRRLL